MRSGRQVQFSQKYPIPHCRKCASATKSVFLAGCIPFVAGLLLIGVATFIIVAFGASAAGLDEYGDSDTNSLVLGAAAGLFAGLIGGFLFELLARVVLLPFFGRALLIAPLLAVQFIKDLDYVAGLAGKVNADASYLEFEFSNDEIAREFEALNREALRDNEV